MHTACSELVEMASRPRRAAALSMKSLRDQHRLSNMIPVDENDDDLPLEDVDDVDSDEEDIIEEQQEITTDEEEDEEDSEVELPLGD